MQAYNHINANNLKQVQSVVANSKASIIAGGTDVLNLLKDNILPDYPEIVVNIKTVPGLDYIKEENNILKIGATTHLADIASHKIIQQKYSALAQAAGLVATPHIREMGTIGGNAIQLPRCWYFRKPENRFHCIRKGGTECFAMTGENRYHSIFGAVNRCIAVNPSDLAPALIVFDTKFVTTKRTINAKDFWDAGLLTSTILEKGEILREIQIPAPTAGLKSIFKKFAQRKSVDFAIVNCAIMLNSDDARICLNGVAPNPYRAVKAEEIIKGKSINEDIAVQAGAAAAADAKPLKDTKYKVQIAKVMVKRALLEIA